jgi:hypothetical protein
MYNFNVRASNETQRSGIFVRSVTLVSVGIGLLTAPLLLQWNVKLVEAFISTPFMYPRCAALPVASKNLV